MQAYQEFTHLCRRWRQFRNMSQLDLALNADISQRHLSYLETGKSQPSREMISRLCEALDIPLRERNKLYESAGFKAKFLEREIDSIDMEPVLSALDRMLIAHDPLPAIVVDRFWSVIRMNRSAEFFFQRVDSALNLAKVMESEDQPLNIALATVHPAGLKSLMTNWHKVAAHFKNRLTREAHYSGDPLVYKTLMRFVELITLDDHHKNEPQEHLLPFIPIDLKLGEHEISLFSLITTFGTPQDITTEELRIEAFYPADDGTRAFFENLLEVNN